MRARARARDDDRLGVAREGVPKGVVEGLALREREFSGRHLRRRRCRYIAQQAVAMRNLKTERVEDVLAHVQQKTQRPLNEDNVHHG